MIRRTNEMGQNVCERVYVLCARVPWRILVNYWLPPLVRVRVRVRVSRGTARDEEALVGCARHAAELRHGEDPLTPRRAPVHHAQHDGLLATASSQAPDGSLLSTADSPRLCFDAMLGRYVRDWAAGAAESALQYAFMLRGASHVLVRASV